MRPRRRGRGRRAGSGAARAALAFAAGLAAAPAALLAGWGVWYLVSLLLSPLAGP